MVESKKYPGTVVDVNNAWTNEDNIKTDDGACAYSSMPGQDDLNYMECSNFGFAIPSGATLDNVYLGHDVVGYNWIGSAYRHTIYFDLYLAGTEFGVATAGKAATSGYDCDDVETKETDILTLLHVKGYTDAQIINILNGESWTWLRAFIRSVQAGGNLTWMDAVWIRVVYTVPPGGAGISGALTSSCFLGLASYVQRQKRRKKVFSLSLQPG